jgi:hypothetical protein
LNQLRNLIAIPLFDKESEGGAMVHEKQIRNEESSALLNQNTDTGTVLISTPLAYARGTVTVPKSGACWKFWRQHFKYFPVFTKYFYSFNPKH